jgi:hypothetical protein
MRCWLWLLLLLAPSSEAQTRYLGHIVKVIEPEPFGADSRSAKGPASVCVEVAPKPQCYTAPAAFGNNPAVEIVELAPSRTAILFSVESGGVSGWQIHFALLRPGREKALDNFFDSDVSLGNQSRHAFWRENTISPFKIFVTADCVWGPDESHFGPHRFIISTHRSKPPLFDGDGDEAYYLQDRYMTVHTYDLQAKPVPDILASERREIMARLARIQAEELRRRARR